MFSDFETATELYAKLNSPPPLLLTASDETCLSSNLNFFIHIANQVDANRLDTFLIMNF